MSKVSIGVMVGFVSVTLVIVVLALLQLLNSLSSRTPISTVPIPVTEITPDSSQYHLEYFQGMPCLVVKNPLDPYPKALTCDWTKWQKPK